MHFNSRLQWSRCVFSKFIANAEHLLRCVRAFFFFDCIQLRAQHGTRCFCFPFSSFVHSKIPTPHKVMQVYSIVTLTVRTLYHGFAVELKHNLVSVSLSISLSFSLFSENRIFGFSMMSVRDQFTSIICLWEIYSELAKHEVSDTTILVYSLSWWWSHVWSSFAAFWSHI